MLKGTLILGSWGILLVSGSIIPSPKVYEDFSRDKSRYDKASFFSGPEAQFWSYYENGLGEKSSPSFGSYERSNPVTWWDHVDSSPYRTVYRTPETDSSRGRILNLSARPRISHGPRRRRSNGKLAVQKLREFLDIPLYCWKVLINCRRFRSHVCCPVMPDFMKPKKDDKAAATQDKLVRSGNKSETTRAANILKPSADESQVQIEDDVKRSRSKRSAGGPVVYKDPLFGIPVVNPNPDMIGPVTVAPPQQQSAIDRSDVNVNVPTCSEIDCHWYPDHNCCQVDRFVPIGPYVQSSLSENWVSALFSLFGNNPLAYVFAKKVFVAALFWIALIIWNKFGQDLGVLPDTKRDLRAQDRMDLEDLSQRVLTAIDGQEWLDKLVGLKDGRSQDGNHSRSSSGSLQKLLCCFVANNSNSGQDEETDESSDGESGKKKMQCFSKEEDESAIQCISNLVYKVKVGSDEQIHL